MSELSTSELRRLDLTLLLVFLGLVRHRKALDVAAELGLTQSAISQSLRRLRDIFGDPLFLRRPHGMEPTAMALALEAPVAAAVDALRGALGVARTFDPATATGLVRVAAFDAEQAVLIPPLAAKLRNLAPGLTLSVLPLGRGAAMDALEGGRADLVLGYVWDTPDVISGEPVYTESFLVAGRPGILPQAPRIDLDAYCAADHVLISPGGDLRGVVDDQLQAMGRGRRVILGLPAFLPALAAVAAFDALVTLPARVARAFAPGFGLVTADPPIPVRTFPVSVFWHRRNDADPGTVWIRQQIREV
ncbi:MAG: LysR family transcriptional regulator [Rhodobacter sp.]|nr:LysR family transcriptional regulator [Rhodobacter sp.]MCA3494589.1 LysR family transcriptional regulator [Rhodobacter sp.]MCA3500562.1 LysR family transcriptional regulator [Rhodobacter sp.]MCA3505138.1 LysR family transcriptional regulator [Rhodobacter sp.]MCA3517013.1 LysR family transcriptional regulator [Rhodobacter sp.]